MRLAKKTRLKALVAQLGSRVERKRVRVAKLKNWVSLPVLTRQGPKRFEISVLAEGLVEHDRMHVVLLRLTKTLSLCTQSEVLWKALRTKTYR